MASVPYIDESFSRSICGPTDLASISVHRSSGRDESSKYVKLLGQPSVHSNGIEMFRVFDSAHLQSPWRLFSCVLPPLLFSRTLTHT